MKIDLSPAQHVNFVDPELFTSVSEVRAGQGRRPGDQPLVVTPDQSHFAPIGEGFEQTTRELGEMTGLDPHLVYAVISEVVAPPDDYFCTATNNDAYYWHADHGIMDATHHVLASSEQGTLTLYGQAEIDEPQPNTTSALWKQLNSFTDKELVNDLGLTIAQAADRTAILLDENTMHKVGANKKPISVRRQLTVAGYKFK